MAILNSTIFSSKRPFYTKIHWKTEKFRNFKEIINLERTPFFVKFWKFIALMYLNKNVLYGYNRIQGFYCLLARYKNL